jgi:hypothetical protein
MRDRLMQFKVFHTNKLTKNSVAFEIKTCARRHRNAAGQPE